MSLATTYLAGLRSRLPGHDLEQLQLAHGASAADVHRLLERYPLCPPGLLQLLEQFDGTQYRDYPGGEVMVLVLGSDVFGYPYGLRSVEQIFEDARGYRESITQIYDGYLDEMPDLIGPGIDGAVPMSDRLCFSHCMNNGGTSQLYIDFDPAPGGTVGQVVRYLHDPDSYEVIAAGFDDYLQRLIDDDYAFIQEADE